MEKLSALEWSESSIAQSVGILNQHDAARQRALLDALGLPLHCEVAPDALAPAFTLDKKNRAGTISWIMLTGIGHAEIRSDIPSEFVQLALNLVCTA